ncbi:SpoIID/LytB domain-containing protein [Propionispora sp. 2/2-37]|uniref:SpoIID/LytB domain-containing protein n=1 Tax=Propionispora sp. 2/2-37 TaxID=1677858 RepID=UPI0006BB6796|nr:SpoIID/LytB domain-containing protein [Propionispora sp. 2/2-37]
MRKIILTVLAFALLQLPAVVLAAVNVRGENGPGDMIRVGLWTNQSSIILSADTDFLIVDTDSKKVLAKFAAKDKVAVSAKGKILINAKAVTGRSISLQPGNYKTGIEVNKRHYRGTITVFLPQGKDGLTVVNTLPVEQYLYGIIAKEISPGWPLEAIKAQAVAARSYALANKNKHGREGFDVCATTDCQVYGGMESENIKSNRAVDDTYGQVLVYKGRVISGYFHSSAGGYTENSENVWGTAYPYLRAVPDFDQGTPNFSWEQRVTADELQGVLQRAGYTIGKLTALELSPLSAAPIANSIDRGISGRVKSILLIGDRGSANLTGIQFRSLLGLRSTLFDIEIITPNDKKIEVRITDSAGDREIKEIPINLPPTKQKGFLLDRGNVHHLSGRPNEVIVINGFGSGHGVGMSQWGAKVMAEKAPQNNTTYFKTILQHYFQGVEIKKIY